MRCSKLELRPNRSIDNVRIGYVVLSAGLLAIGLVAYTITLNGSIDRSDRNGKKIVAFFNNFHTGACLWWAYDGLTTWTPARDAGIIKWGLAGQNLPGRGKRVYLSESGDISGSLTNTMISERIKKYLNLNIVPVFEIHFENFETFTETYVRNFFLKLQSWIDSVNSSKFVVWSAGAELNFPDGDSGWEEYKIDYRDYNRQMPMIRQVRDSMGLQNKILLGGHCNLLKVYFPDSGGAVSQDWFTGFVGINEYIDGYACNDVFGASHYMGSGSMWQETLLNSWKRSKIIWEKVCTKAGKTIPFIFFEYCVGDPFNGGSSVSKDAVTYTYSTLLANNQWCKGLNWYVYSYITNDAIQEMIRLAKICG